MNRSFKGSFIIVLLILEFTHPSYEWTPHIDGKNVTEVEIKHNTLTAIFKPILNSKYSDQLDSYINTFINNRPTKLTTHTANVNSSCKPNTGVEKGDRDREEIKNKYDNLWSSLGLIFDTETHKVPLSMYSRDKISKDRRNTTENKAHLHQIKKEIMKMISKPLKRNKVSVAVDNSNVTVPPTDNNNENNDTTNFISYDINKNNTNATFFLDDITEDYKSTSVHMYKCTNSISGNSHKESIFPGDIDDNSSNANVIPENINENNSNLNVSPEYITENSSNASIFSNNINEYNRNVSSDDTTENIDNALGYLTESANRTLYLLNTFNNILQNEIALKYTSQPTSAKPNNGTLEMKPTNFGSLLEKYKHYLCEQLRLVEKNRLMSTGINGTKQTHIKTDNHESHADEIRKPENLQIKIPEMQQENSDNQTIDIKKPNTESNTETVYEDQEDLVTQTDITNVKDANKLLATILRRKKPQSLSQSGSKNDSLTKSVLTKLKNRLQNFFSSKFGVRLGQPYHLSNEISDNLKKIAGGAAIGALALGTIIANPLQVGLSRSDDGDAFGWQKTMMLWDKNEEFSDGVPDYDDSEEENEGRHTPSMYFSANNFQYRDTYPYTSLAHHNNHYTSTLPSDYYYDRNKPQHEYIRRNDYLHQNLYSPQSHIETLLSKRRPDRLPLKNVENGKKREFDEEWKPKNLSNNEHYQQKNNSNTISKSEAYKDWRPTNLSNNEHYQQKNNSNTISKSEVYKDWRPTNLSNTEQYQQKDNLNIISNSDDGFRPIFPNYQNKYKNRNRINKPDINLGKGNTKEENMNQRNESKKLEEQ